MTALRITNPGGLIPRLAARALPEGGAQVAANVSVLPGEWRPMRKPRFLWAPSFSPDALQSVYRLDDTTWFGWTRANVRVERAPLEGEARYIITGDGVPKVLTKALALPVSASGKPAGARSLGVPSPLVKPSVAASGGSGANVTRFYLYTFVSDWVEEGSTSPVSTVLTGKVDDTWNITGMDATPANSGTVIGATKTATTVTFQTNANHYLRVGDEFTVGSIVGMTDANGVWTASAVPDATHVTITLTTAQTYTSGGAWARTTPWGPCTKRLYRTTGTTGDFQLVAENIAGTSYADTLTDALIPGDSIVSEGWGPPPATLTGIVGMPNGMIVGFLEGGRTLCFAEPYQPHAWPEAYQIKLPDDVVGIATWDTYIGVATKGMPMVLNGVQPGQLSQTRHAKPFPCVSRSSVCSIADGCVFATKNGLARMDIGGVMVFTEPLFMPEQWNALQPANLSCAFDGTRLFLATPVQNRLFVLNLIDGGAMVNAFQRLNCTHADPRTGDLYFALKDKVYRFDSFDTAPMVMDWMSREYVLAKPANLGAAKVEYDEAYSAEARIAIAAERAEIIAANQALMASAGGGRGALNQRSLNVIEINGSILADLPVPDPAVSFTYYVNGKLVFSTQITSQKGFRLPAGYRADTFAVRLQANTQIRAVVLADTPSALAGA